MPRIITYTNDTEINPEDKLLGTDGKEGLTFGKTKNFYLGDIATYVVDKLISPDATSFKIPLFRDLNNTLGQNATRITDSIISQNTYPSGTKISIAGSLNVTTNAEIDGRIDASQVRVNSSGTAPGLVLSSDSSSGTRIKLENTNETTAWISSRGGNVGIGATDGNSASNLNIKKSNGFVGINQKNPQAPLHIKNDGEAIILECRGDNVSSIDFVQETGANVIQRGHIQYDNATDTIEIKTTNPTGQQSEIKFSTAFGVGEDAQERMRIKGKQVVIGNPSSVESTRELYVKGGIEATGQLWVRDNAEIKGRCHADSFKVEGLNTAPASRTDFGKQGEIRFTADYIYVCVTENNWKRTALTSW